jgi:hypothetical protein
MTFSSGMSLQPLARLQTQPFDPSPRLQMPDTVLGTGCEQPKSFPAGDTQDSSQGILRALSTNLLYKPSSMVVSSPGDLDNSKPLASMLSSLKV